MDISADLYELSRTPMTVVSAGVKSILDIGLTLEYLVCICMEIYSTCCTLYIYTCIDIVFYEHIFCCGLFHILDDRVSTLHNLD